MPALCRAQPADLSQHFADSVLRRHAEPTAASGPSTAWDEETATELEGLEAAWYNTANGDYFRFAERAVDARLEAQSSGADKQPVEPAQDAMLARQLLVLYRVTLSEKYYHAATQLRDRLALSCGISLAATPTAHAQETSRSVCRAQPFLAEYASVFRKRDDFAAITSSLLRRSEQGDQPTETAKTASSQDQGRLAADLVDSLPDYPPNDPGRAQLISALNRLAVSAVREQDGALSATLTGVSNPHQLVSPQAVCLHIYALLKGVRYGYLPMSYSALAKSAWYNIQRHAGQGETIGALLLAATEMDRAPTATRALGQTILVDAWYNSQQRKNAAGQMESFHYKWSDFSDSGYSLLGHMFRSYGLSTGTLDSAPTKDNLRRAQFYLIASPDIPVKNPNPHYMTDRDAAEVASWVQNGGVLILMENDPPNADIAHLNLLAERFGIHFNDKLSHHILGEHVEDGTIRVQPDGRLFRVAHTLYMKDTCSISLRDTATALLRDRGDVVMATAKYGRGIVFAAVDPWLYNEYTDGRRNAQIYGQFDNFAGGKELVRWLLEQRPVGTPSGINK